MKKLSLLAALLFLFHYSKGQSKQGMTLNLTTGYCFSSSFEAYKDSSTSYKATLEKGMKYGLDLGYVIDKNFSVNLSFQYQKASMQADVRTRGNNFQQILPVDLLWIQAGGTSYLPFGRFNVFLGTYLGLGLYNFRNAPAVDKNSPARFAWSVRSGLGYFITKRVGINARVDALFSTDPLTKQFSTPGLDEGKTGFNSIFQFSIAGGITVLLF
jgi:hypothetical protein